MPHPPSSPLDPPRRRLVALVLLAFVLRVRPIDRGLPFAEAFTSDTERFVAVAAQMAEEGDGNPHWFGHPGATFIGPLALSFWAVDRSLPRPATFADDPAPFYVMGRLLSALYGTLAILLTYILGRQLGGRRAGLVAGWLMAVSPTHAYFSQIARADTAAVVFTAATLIGCVRIVRRPMGHHVRRSYVLTGIAAGLAIASKYIAGPVALVIPLAHWLRARSKATATRNLALALVLVPVAFAAASPYAILDAPRALRDLTVEMRSTHLGADGLSPVGNAAWYIGHALPLGLGALSVVVAAVGAYCLPRRSARTGWLLGAHAIAFTTLASLSALHWSHWLLPIFPTVAALAGIGADRTARFAGRIGRRSSTSRGTGASTDRVARPSASRWAIAPIALVLGWPSATIVLRSLAAHGRPDTRLVAKAWLERNLPERTQLVREAYTAPVAADRFDVRTEFSLSRRQLRQYIDDGASYVMTSSAIDSRFSAEPERYERELRFYDRLARCAQLVYEVGPVAGQRLGPTIRVYRLPPAARADDACSAR